VNLVHQIPVSKIIKKPANQRILTAKKELASFFNGEYFC